MLDGFTVAVVIAGAVLLYGGLSVAALAGFAGRPRTMGVALGVAALGLLIIAVVL